MNRRMAIGLGFLLAVIAVLMPFSGRGNAPSSRNQLSLAYPPVVNATIDEALQRYERLLTEKAPDVAAALRPGLTVEAIDELEARYDVFLGGDLRSLYRWHDGVSSVAAELVPGHYFPPLEEALQLRDALKKDVVEAPGLQRLAFTALMGDRFEWLQVLDDGAGDGYFYNPDFRDQPGAFFYHFTETGFYVRFPALANFVMGAVECWDQGAYDFDPATARLTEDPRRAQRIWRRYGTVHH